MSILSPEMQGLLAVMAIVALISPLIGPCEDEDIEEPEEDPVEIDDESQL